LDTLTENSSYPPFSSLLILQISFYFSSFIIFLKLSRIFRIFREIRIREICTCTQVTGQSDACCDARNFPMVEGFEGIKFQLWISGIRTLTGTSIEETSGK